jgi:hypothetical protein
MAAHIAVTYRPIASAPTLFQILRSFLRGHVGCCPNSEPFVLICLFNYLNFQTREPIKVWPHYRQAFAWTYQGMAISPEYHRRQAATLLQLAQNTRDPDTANALLQIVAEHVARAEEAVARTAVPADVAALR